MRLLMPGDGWSRAAARSKSVAKVLAGPTGPRLHAVLTVPAHANLLADEQWLNRLDATAATEKSTVKLVRTLLVALASATPVADRPDAASGASPLLVSNANSTVATHTVLAAAHLLGPTAVGHIAVILRRLTDEPWAAQRTSVRDACAAALAAIGTPEAIDELHAAVSRAQTKGQRELLLLCIARAPRDAAGKSRIAEATVPTHGLDVTGSRELTMHHRQYTITLHEDGSVTSRSLEDADVVRHEGAERVIGTELRAIKATYRKEVERLEALLATDRSWTPEQWRQLYLDHPITRAVASRLVWQLELGWNAAGKRETGRRVGWSGAGKREAGQTEAAMAEVIPAWSVVGLFRAVNGQVTDAGGLSGEDRLAGAGWPEGDVRIKAVRLWHPRDATAADLAAWRDLLRSAPFGSAFAQPFPQIERRFTAEGGYADKTEFDRQAGVQMEVASWDAALSRIRWGVSGKTDGKNVDRGEFIHRDFPDEKVTAIVLFTRLAAVPSRPAGGSERGDGAVGADVAGLADTTGLADPAEPADISRLADIAGPFNPSDPADAIPERIRLGVAWIHRTEDKSLTPLPLDAVSPRLCSEVERDLAVLTATLEDAVTGSENTLPPADVSDTLP